MTIEEAEARIAKRMLTAASTKTDPATSLRSSGGMDELERRMNEAKRLYLQAEHSIETADLRATVAWNKYLASKLRYEAARSSIDEAQRPVGKNV